MSKPGLKSFSFQFFLFLVFLTPRYFVFPRRYSFGPLALALNGATFWSPSRFFDVLGILLCSGIAIIGKTSRAKCAQMRSPRFRIPMYESF